MGRVVVAGSINMDMVAEVERHPEAGETVRGRELHYIPGGKGCNQAVAAARLESDVDLVGKVGDDAFGEQLLDFIEKEEMGTEHVSVSRKSPTGTALITVEEGGENRIVVISGSNHELGPEDIEDVDLDEEDVVVSQFEIPKKTIESLFRRAREKGATTVLNPAPAENCSEELLSLVDYLVVNETELAFFAGLKEVPEGVEDIVSEARDVSQSQNQAVIVTLGSEGVICVSENETLEIDSHDVEVVDTTAAGDCFVGAFATALSEGVGLAEAIEFANSTSAVSVQQLGASPSLPKREAVDMFIDEYS